LHNVHNAGHDVTPLCVVHEYPLKPPNVRHAINIGLAVWEFAGARGVPLSFAKAFKEFDAIAAPSAWVCDQFRAVTDTPMHTIQWGIDPAEFAPTGSVYTPLPDAETVLLWVGGTDRRHGFDVAIEVMDALPDSYHLLAKQSAHYPAHGVEHPQITVIRDDLPSLAPLYRACDLLLHTARGVGFSLPVLEALACGMPVVSTDLPPVREYAPDDRVAFGGGAWQAAGRHHVHPDCVPEWFEPDVEALAQAVLNAKRGAWNAPEWVNQWTWDAAARRLSEVLLDLGESNGF
jgi:glycosyltransferase involved in cell wall biosynthesis